jgi:large subunit ribosomal protein L33
VGQFSRRSVNGAGELAPFTERRLTWLLTSKETSMREYVWLECTVCGARNYRAQKETRGTDRLELKKFCRKERKHTPHKESRKK